MIFRRVRERLAELERQRLEKVEKLRALEAEAPQDDPGDVDLLDELPIVAGGLSQAPEDILRRIFQALRLSMRYDKVAGRASCEVAISEDALDEVLAASTLALRAPSFTRYEPKRPGRWTQARADARDVARRRCRYPGRSRPRQGTRQRRSGHARRQGVGGGTCSRGASCPPDLLP